ncbi:MAG TPA: ABC transporter substrate-binding protein [Solirubrobacteraceae bacterium]
MPSRVLVRSRAASLCAGLAAILLAGCGSTSGGNSAVSVSGSTLTVYAGQPPGGSGGQAAADTLDAEQLALTQAGGKAGKFAVKLIKLHGAEISDNARTAIQNKTTIGYLGELQPGTSQVSVQILNQQGVLVVSPADTADYLTQSSPAVAGSPSKYYPSRSTYHETFARVVPNSAAEAEAQVQEMHSLGVTKLYVASDGQPYGAALAQEVSQDARQAGLGVVSGPGNQSAVKSSAADGMFYGASDDSPSAAKAATAVLDGASGAVPTIKLFAPSGLYDAAFVSGLSAATQERITLSSPGFLPKNLTAAGRQFVSSFRSAYGRQPATEAIFGYEAMSALLAVIGSAGANANNRADIVSDFRAIKNRQSAIGTYSIEGGDPSIAPFVFSHVHGGQLVPERFLQVQG